MNKKLRQFERLSIRQQTKRIKDFVKLQIMSAKSTPSVAIVKAKLMANSGPIIRIVPGNTKKVILGKDSIKTLVVQRQNNVKLQTIPSTSTSDLADFVCKTEEEDLSCYEYDNVTSDNELPIVHSTPQQKTQMQKSKINILKRTAANSFSSTPEKVTKVHNEQCCCSCRETLDLILKQQEEILNYLKNGKTIISSDKKLDLLPNMPFNDINDFLDFDESLSHENVRNQFLIKLNKLLVSTEQKSISNIMASIMTNELCRTISWIGIKDTIAFGNTHMVDLIVDMVQEHHLLDIDVVKSRIAEWLRRCGDRIGNELRKNKKKAEQGITT